MQKVMKLFLSLVLVFTTLFSYTPSIIYAQEEDPVIEISQELETGEEGSEEVLPAEQEEETVPAEEEPREELPEEESKAVEEETAEVLPIENEVLEPQELIQDPASFRAVKEENGDIHLSSDAAGLIDHCLDEAVWISIQNESSSYQIGNGYGQEFKYKNHYFSVEEDGSGERYILISHDDLLSNYIPSGSYSFSVSYGEDTYVSEPIEIDACSKAPTGLSAREENGELLIYGDPDFLQAMLIGKYNNRLSSENSEYGSYMDIEVGSSSNRIERISFPGDGFDVFTSIPEYDEAGQVLRITSNALKGNNVPNGENATIYFYAIGYETVSVNVDGGITLGSLNEKVPFTISQDKDSGDIRITSDNEEWLKSLIEVREYNNAGTNSFGSSISMFTDAGDQMDFSNYFYNTPRFPNMTQTQVFYDQEGGFVYIPFEIVKGKNKEEGTTFNRFSINALGYGFYEYRYEEDGTQLVILKGTEAAPDDIELEELGNGDIKISSDDEQWLNDLVKVPTSYGSGVKLFVDDSSSRLFANSKYNTCLLLEDGYVLLKHQSILRNNVTNGNWNIQVIVEGYEPSPTFEIGLVNACKPAPQDIRAESDGYGNLIISSEETGWIENMVFGVEDEGKLERCNISVDDSSHNFKAGLYDGLLDYHFVIADDHKSFKVPNAMVRNRDLSDGDFYFYFYCYGYVSYTMQELVHINEFRKAAPDDATDVSQDENGDLWVTSRYSDWLEEIKELQSADNWPCIGFNDGSVPLVDDYPYITFEENEGKIEGFYISHEALLGSNVSSGDQQISFPETDSYQGFTLPLDFALDASKQIPAGLKVEETEEGIRFFFDETGEEERAFLREMVHPRRYDHTGEKDIQTDGTYIDVYDKDWDKTLYAQNNEHLFPNSNPSINNSIFLSEDGSYAYIDHNTVMRSELLNSSTEKYFIQLHVYGYTTYSSPDFYLDGLRYANEAVREDLSIEASIDEDMNLIVRSNDEEWLEAACIQWIQGAVSNSFAGSSIRIINSETGRSIDFRNELYYYTPNESNLRSDYELKIDEEGKYLFFSKEVLQERFSLSQDKGIAGTKYTFVFNTYGYETFVTDAQTQGQYFSFPEDLIKTSPALNIYENDNGDIVIGGNESDENYLRYFDLLTGDASSCIMLNVGNRGYRIDVKSVLQQNGARIEGSTLVILNEQILERGLTNGEIEVRTQVIGYEHFSKTLAITRGCKEAPAEVEVETDSDKNLVIRASDPSFLSSLIDKGWLEFYVNNEHFHIGGRMLKLSGNSAVLDKDEMTDLEDGNYLLRIRSYGYVEVTKQIALSGYANKPTADVFADASTGALVITCDDGDFLDALMEPSVDEWTAGDHSHTEGSYIEIVQDGWYHSFSNRVSRYDGGNEDRYDEYTLSSGKISLGNRELINRGIFDADNVEIILHARGYSSVKIGNVDFKKVCSPLIPDFDIVQEENGDISIISTDNEWLKALCVKNDFENRIDGGSVSFRTTVYNDIETYIRNTSYETYLIYANGKVTIPASALIDNQVRNGEYVLWLEPYKYRLAEDDTVLKITNGVKSVPEGITAKLNAAGDLVIASVAEGNEGYLENLTRWWKYDANDKLVQKGSEILVLTSNNTASVFSNREFVKYKDKNEEVRYDAQNKQVIIARSFLYNTSGDSLNLEINCYGYERLSLPNVSFPLITVPFAEMLAGAKAQFKVNTEKKVYWSVDNETLASVDEQGWLTTKEIGTVRLSARVEGNDHVDTIEVHITSPANVSLSVSPTKADAVVGEPIQIVPTVKNGGNYYTVKFESSDTSVATVNEQGLVSFLNPGKVTITSSVYGKSATSVFTVYEVSRSAKLTASIDGYDAKVGMEALDKAQLKVTAAGEEVEAASLEFSSANEAIATIDETGKITALKSGSVKLTAKLADDPAKRSCTFTLKVYPRVLTSLSFSAEDQAQILTKQEYEDGVLNIYLNAKNSIKKTFKLLPQGTDKLGEVAAAEAVNYAPVDASVAAVAKDGTVTVKKAGQTAVKATVTSNPKGSEPVTCEIVIRVIDYSPKLEAAKTTVNKYFDAGTDVNIYPVAGSVIKDIKLYNAKLYNSGVKEASDFIVSYKAGESSFNIKQSAAVKAEAKGKTYAEILHVTLEDGSEYDYAYSVAVSTVLPKTTVKPTGKYNTVLDYSTLGLDITVKTEEDYTLKFVDDWAKMDEDGKISLLSKDQKGNYILKGKVQIGYEGYTLPAGVNCFNVSFASEKTLPSTVISSDNPDWVVKNVLNLNSNFLTSALLNVDSSNEEFAISDVTFNEKQDYTAKGLSISYAEGKLRIDLDKETAVYGNYTYALTPYITVKGVKTALKNVNLTVKVSDKLPKVTLSPANVKLNKLFHETVTSKVKITDMPSGAELLRFEVSGPDAIKDPVYEEGEVRFELKAGAEKGAKKYQLTPVYTGGVKGTPVNLNVNVIDAAAKASFSIKGSLNQFDPQNEEGCLATIKLSNVQANVTGIAVTSDLVEAKLNEDGKAVFTLKKASIGDQTLKNVPVRLTLDTGDVLDTAVTLKIARKAPALKLGVKTLNVYDTTRRNAEVGRVALQGHDYGEIAAFWYSKSLAYRLEYDAQTDEIVVYLIDAANVKTGSSSNITIKIDYVGDHGTYEESLADKTIKGLKTTTLTLTIKDASALVKTK